MKYSLAFFVAIWLTGCSIFGAPTEIDDTKGGPFNGVYKQMSAPTLSVW